MSQNKKPRGRPRIYSTNAARKKAYRDRKKAERIALEKRVLDLETQLGKLDVSDPIFNLTYSDIFDSDTTSLTKLQFDIKKRLPEKMTVLSPFHVIIKNLTEPNDSPATKKLLDDIDELFLSNRENIRYMSILHIVENELAKRDHHSVDEYELQLLEQRIDELEQEVRRKKDLKELKH
jgi:hypothetical protein